MRAFAAIGVGLATRTAKAGKVLDTWFPIMTTGADDGVFSLLAAALGHDGGTASYELSADGLSASELPPDHPEVRTLATLMATPRSPRPTGTERFAVATFIDHLDGPPQDVHDAYLRLHLLSHRLVRPHGANLDGVFRLLSNVVWTDLGPCDPDGFEDLRVQLTAAGHQVRVTSVDKFPRMTDYVLPSGVRIADADRVRLGAHLAPGTTVMHEGFVNFNAGTLGASMVEGRISAGVVVGDRSDLGGGSSVMGTLSGGGREVVRIGEDCLVGANAGVGISLGDGCVVEAGLYVTAGTKVTLPDGRVARARELSGHDGMLFRRDSQTGTVVVLPREGVAGDWGGLNAALHANQ